MGGVLYQQTLGSDGAMKPQVLALLSEKLSPTAQKWDTYKRECYGIVSSVKKCEWFLRGKPFVVETDHRNLTYMEQSTQAIVIRWRILLQSYPIIASRHIPRTQNLVADWLSNFYSLFGYIPPSTFLIQQYLQSGERGGSGSE